MVVEVSYALCKAFNESCRKKDMVLASAMVLMRVFAVGRTRVL